jgi:hypothetical protein
MAGQNHHTHDHMMNPVLGFPNHVLDACVTSAYPAWFPCASHTHTSADGCIQPLFAVQRADCM